MSSLILTDQTFDKWVPGTDTAVLTVGTQEPNSVVTNCIINGNGAEWGLKMPGNVGSVFNNCHIHGGKERALDMVKGSGVRFNDCVFGPGNPPDRPPDRNPTKSKWAFASTCDIGIKGGNSDTQFNRCVMTDLLLGDHCIYDNPGVGTKTTGTVLTDCIHPSGKDTPIILRVLNAELPKLVNTKAVALVYWGPVVRIYFWIAGKWIDSRKTP